MAAASRSDLAYFACRSFHPHPRRRPPMLGDPSVAFQRSNRTAWRFGAPHVQRQSCSRIAGARPQRTSSDGGASSRSSSWARTGHTARAGLVLPGFKLVYVEFGFAPARLRRLSDDDLLSTKARRGRGETIRTDAAPPSTGCGKQHGARWHVVRRVYPLA